MLDGLAVLLRDLALLLETACRHGGELPTYFLYLLVKLLAVSIGEQDHGMEAILIAIHPFLV
jgi:hypothetical protein